MKIGIVKLYGNINEWGDNSGKMFSERFNLVADNSDEIELHVHCYGGNVFEGNLIFNLIKGCKKPVDIYIDGVAASMGTIVMLAGRKVYMAENALLMIHAPSGDVNGTAADLLKAAKLLQGIEKNFKKVFSAKTGKTEDQVAEWLIGDNWFTAEEAEMEKLIDGRVNSIAQNISTPTRAELKDVTPKALYMRYEAVLNTNSKINNENQVKMNKQQLIAHYGLTGVTAESSDADILAAIDKKIAEERTAKETAVNALNAQKDSAITAKVDEAIAAKKITAAQKDQFVSIGKSAGIESLTVALDAIKTTPNITSMLNGGKSATTTAASGDRSGWDFDKYQKEDPAGLVAMAESDYDSFNAIYKAKFKVDAPK